MNKILPSVLVATAIFANATTTKEAEDSKIRVKFSGEAEFDIYTGDIINDDELNHSYASTFGLNVDVQLNEKWSAAVALEADGETTEPEAIYNGAFIQYAPNENFTVKLGDLTFSEGVFEAYYGYDDPADDAAGMTERDIRGVEVNFLGLQLGLGFGRGDNDIRSICSGVDEENNPICEEESGKNYTIHGAYEFDYAGQHLRPYVNYKSYQSTQHNELHAGIDAGLNLGGFSFRAVYGFHADYLGDDGDVVEGEDLTSTAHSLLAEPSFEISIFQIKTSVFYAFINEGYETLEAENDFAEYFFLYGEPSVKVAEFIQIGIPVEFHTNTLDDDNDSEATLDFGARVYFNPVENLEITAFGMVGVAMLDNESDTGLLLGLETVFGF